MEPPIDPSQWDLDVDIEVYPDEVDGGWIAEIPAFPGCLSQGETEEEAIENAINALLSLGVMET